MRLVLLLVACGSLLLATPRIEPRLPPPQPSDTATIAVEAERGDILTADVTSPAPSWERSGQQRLWTEAAVVPGAERILSEFGGPRGREDRTPVVGRPDLLDRLVLSSAANILAACMLLFCTGLFSIAVTEQLLRPAGPRS